MELHNLDIVQIELEFQAGKLSSYDVHLVACVLFVLSQQRRESFMLIYASF